MKKELHDNRPERIKNTEIVTGGGAAFKTNQERINFLENEYLNSKAFDSQIKLFLQVNHK